MNLSETRMRSSFLIGCLWTLTSLASAQELIVLTGARILPVASPAIEDGMLIVAGGKIQAVGKGLAVPEGARVIDASGQVITPGLVDANAQLGLDPRDLNEHAKEVTPQMRVLEALDPADRRLGRARARGVTTVHITPGNRTVVGGLGAVIKTAGDTIAAMRVKEDASLRVALGSEPAQGNRPIRGGAPIGNSYRRPTTRMGVVFALRKAFHDAKTQAERTVEPNSPPPDPGLEVLQRALRRELKVFTTARAEQDIRTALRIAEEYGYVPVIDEAPEAYRVIQLLADAKVELLLGAPSQTQVSGNGAGDGAEPIWATANELARLGIKFAIHTGTNLGSMDLLHEAMFAVRNGLSPEQALRAVTLSPAEILGVADRVGSLSPGKDADFVVWSGDPFDPTSNAVRVFVGGVETP